MVLLLSPLPESIACYPQGKHVLLLTINSIPDEAGCCPVLQTFWADVAISGDGNRNTIF